jgi:mRNA interferase HicA
MGHTYILRNGSRYFYAGIAYLKKCLPNGSIFTTFVSPVANVFFNMKSSEFHRKVRRNGWRHIRTEGSHYIYEKHGLTYSVPFHGSKEIGEGLRKKFVKEMGLK